MPRARARAAVGGVLLVTLVALGLRLVGIGALLPQCAEPDANVVAQAERIRAGDLGENRNLARKYPHLLARTLATLPAPVEAAGPVPLEEHVSRARDPYLRGRVLVAALAALLVPGTWLLLRRFFAPGWALFGAGLVAVSLLHVVNSQQARPHGALATISLFALLACLRLRRDPTPSSHVLAGVAVGAAVSTLQSGWMLFPALGAALLLAERRADGAPSLVHRVALAVLAALPVVAFAAVFYPWGGLGESESARAFFRVGGLQRGLDDWNGGGFAKLPGLLWGYDPALAALAALGALAWLGSRRVRSAPDAARAGRARDLWVIAGFVAPTTASIGLYDFTTPRYLLPLLPFLAGAATGGARWAGSALGRAIPSGAAAGLVVVLSLALPTYASARMGYQRTRPDTLSRAARWIETHVAEDETLLVFPGLSLPLRYSPRSVLELTRARSPWSTPWLAYQRRVAPWTADEPTWEVDLFAREWDSGHGAVPRGAEDVHRILEHWGRGYVLLSDVESTSPSLAPALDELGERVAAFPEEPLPAGVRARRGYQDFDMLARVLHGSAWGPRLVLYRFELPPPSSP